MKAAQLTGHGANLEASRDPYAELKAAHAAGKVIEQVGHGSGDWFACGPEIGWTRPPECYRVQTFILPPPPPGMQWHRVDGWKEGDVPEGTRPLVDGECWIVGDAIRRQGRTHWEIAGTPGDIINDPVSKETSPCRTTRPLVFTHAGKEWTWHRAGDPCPVKDNAVIDLLFLDMEIWTSRAVGEGFFWSSTKQENAILGWRYAEPETKEVELGPEDVPPGSVITQDPIHDYWVMVSHCGPHSVSYHDGARAEILHYRELKGQCWLINRSIPLTGKWNPEAWEKCSKTAAVEHS